MWSDLRYRLRALFRRDDMERELAEELQFHRDRDAQHHASGRTHGGLVGIEQIKEACRDERGIAGIDRLRQDLRYAWRMMLKRPAFTSVVIGTLGLGIGGATTMFGVVDGVLLKPLPYRDADRIVQIGRSFGGVRVSAASAADYAELALRSRALERVAVARTETVDVSGGSSPERLEAVTVSASYFELLGIAPALGQAFSANEDRPGARQLVVVSDRLWRRRLEADPNAVGRTLLVNGEPHTIVAVMPRWFRGPEALGQEKADLWRPLGRLTLSSDPDDASFGTIASLATGIHPSAAAQEFDRIGRRFWLAPLHGETIGDVAPGLWLLFGAVSLLLLIACTNVANLFLMRATERTREIAVRVAMGAGRGRIARQLLTETVCFGLAGGLVGAAVAYGAIGFVRAWAPADLPRIADLQVDLRVLLFAFFIAGLAGTVFGLLPALDARRSDFAGILRGSSSSVTAGRIHLRQRGFVVIVQTGLAAMLLVGAGLLANSVLRLVRVAPGFDPANVVWIDMNLPDRAYAGAAPKATFFDDVVRQSINLPGLTAVSLVQGPPLGGGNSVSTIAPEGQLPPEGTQPPRVPYHVVTPGYFDTLRTPLLDGRDFNARDINSSPRVAIVNRAFAGRFWPGDRAVGKRFWMGRVAADAPLVEIIGVVEDVRQYGLRDAPIPMVYRALAQLPRAAATMLARHDGRSPAAVIDQLRAAVWRLDSSLPLDRAGTMDAVVSRSVREPRFRALALSAFGAIACGIACIGLYGALAWLVSARSRELGLRIALGADADQLRWMILRRGMLLASAGIVLGLASAMAGANLLASMTFGISPRDVPTYAFAGGTMLLVALVASWLPARRAARTDPITIMKD